MGKLQTREIRTSVDAHLHKKLRLLAASKDQTLSELVRKALNQYIAREEDPEMAHVPHHRRHS